MQAAEAVSLSDADRTALELAGATYKYPAVRETHAREQLGLGPVEFWARVNALLDDPAAEAELPLVVRRLRRMRAARRDVRTARRLEAVRH